MEDEYTIEKGEQVTLITNSMEQKIITNNLLNNLTAEAKFVLYVVFNTPGELSEILFGGERHHNNKLPNRSRKLNQIFPNKCNEKAVYRYLRLVGWEIPTIWKTIRELRKFTKEIPT